MGKRKLARSNTVALGLVLAFGLAHAVSESEKEEIYACRDEDGNVVYQNDPCVEPLAKDPTVKAPEPGLPARENSAPAAPPRAAGTPAPRPTVSSWKVVRPSSNKAPGAVSTFATQTFPTALDSVSRAKAPSFDSPSDTWRVFLGGIESGDLRTVVACLTPSALDGLGVAGEPVPLSELQEIVSSFVRIESEGHFGPFWSIYGVRPKRRPKWIFFEKTDRGEWKISGI